MRQRGVRRHTDLVSEVQEQQQANHPCGAGRQGVAREVREGNGRGNLGGGRAQREWEGHGESMGEESYELPRLGPCPHYNATSLGSGPVRAVARHPSPYCNNNINAIRGDMHATHKRGTGDARVMHTHFKRGESDERGRTRDASVLET